MTWWDTDKESLVTDLELRSSQAEEQNIIWENRIHEFLHDVMAFLMTYISFITGQDQL